MSLPQLPASVARQRQALREQILHVTPASFTSLALTVFRYQAAQNPIYRRYLHHLGVTPDHIAELHRIPFMPIDFFKNHSIRTGFDDATNASPELLTFASSGTTGQNTSRHYVPDPDLYDTISTRIFEETYGPLQNLPILALLPSYLERNNSSLVYMVQRFMDRSGSPDSGFFLNDHAALTDRLNQLTNQHRKAGKPDQKILLIGVTFGLLDWAESSRDLTFLGQNPNLIVMETGGMKGRRKELLREEVHALLTQQLGVSAIHSEYGMTELLSQAYSTGNGVFAPSPTLRVFLRDINDPFLLYTSEESERRTGVTLTGERRTGGINVVDLANLDSCAFVETQDLGQYVGNTGSFRVIGRFDNSDVRGCNLLILG